MIALIFDSNTVAAEVRPHINGLLQTHFNSPFWMWRQHNLSKNPTYGHGKVFMKVIISAVGGATGSVVISPHSLNYHLSLF